MPTVVFGDPAVGDLQRDATLRVVVQRGGGGALRGEVAPQGHHDALAAGVGEGRKRGVQK